MIREKVILSMKIIKATELMALKRKVRFPLSFHSLLKIVLN